MTLHPLAGMHAFIGPIGTTELILLVIVIGIPLMIGIVVLLIVSQRKPAAPPPPPLPAGHSVEERLSELESLRAKNLITDAEYQEKRGRIIGSV